METVFSGTIGHKKQQEYLQKNLQNGHIFHAYVFSGPSEVGKRRLAHQFARKLLQVEEDVSLETSVNFKEISVPVDEKTGEKKSQIPVQLIREANEWVRLSSFGNEYKVLIIDDAERLSTAAQNALLKTLEEPREKTVIILVAKSEEYLLPTVLSRSVVLPFFLLSKEEMQKLELSSEAEAQHVREKSLGRPGMALSVTDEEAAELNELYEDVRSLLTGSFPVRIREAGVIAKRSRSEVTKRLTILEEVLRVQLLNSFGCKKWSHDLQEIQFSNDFNVAAALQATQEAKYAIQKNGSVNLALENIIIQSS